MKKHIVVLITVIIIATVVSIILIEINIGKRKQQNDTKQTNESITDEKQDNTNIESDNDIQEEQENTNMKIDDNTQEEQQSLVKNEGNQNIVKEQNKQEQINKNTTSSSKKDNGIVTNAENKKEETSNQPTKPTTVPVTKPVEKVKETEKPIYQETVKPEKEVGAKYVINNEMINRIKSTIESNPSEDMISYGYNVVVDSSITTLTNQFTYTDKRIIDKIKLRFGTIKIYAQDYYNNGEFVCTQCFIL